MSVGLATETRDVFLVRPPGLSHGLVPWVSIALFLQPIQSQDAQHKAGHDGSRQPSSYDEGHDCGGPDRADVPPTKIVPAELPNLWWVGGF